MSDQTPFIGLTQERLNNLYDISLYDSDLEGEYPVYEIQRSDKVIGGPYIPEVYEDPDVNPELAQEPVPVNNRQAYELGVRDAYINTRLTTVKNNLQQQIDDINAKSDVVDIVASYDALEHYDTSGLTDKDVIKVLQDETQQYRCTYYRYDQENDRWDLIGSERTSVPQLINDDTDPIIPSDDTFYVITDSGLNLTLGTGAGTAYYSGMRIGFLAGYDFNLTYDTNKTASVKANQVYSLIYNGSNWVEEQSNAINANVNQPWKTFKGTGNYIYYYDGSNIASTYDIPSDKCAVSVVWENQTNGTALIVDQLTGNVYTKVLNNSQTWSAAKQMADDSLVVHLAGDETITGTKTFNVSPTTVSASAPGIVSTRIKVTGQNPSSGTSYSQIDFYKENTAKAHLGYTNDGNDPAVETMTLGTESTDVSLVLGQNPSVANANALKFDSNGVWKGGEADTFAQSKLLSTIGDLTTGIYTLTNKTISKRDNIIREDAQLITENTSLNFSTGSPYCIEKDVQYYLSGSTAITVTLPNLTGTDIEKFSGLTKIFTSNDIDNSIVFYDEDGTYQTATLKAGETAKFKSCYDYTNNRIYWKKDVSDPDPVILSTPATTYNTGEVIYDNSNQIVAAENIVLELGSGDKQGREISVTFLYDGTLIYTDQDGVQQSEVVSANTVSKFKWTGTGWIYETQKIGFSIISEYPLIPRLSSNSDQGFTLVPSSQLTNYEAYKAFNDHPIMYNIGGTIMYDPTSFATVNDGDNGYLEVLHNSIVTRYKYLHIIDRGSGSNNYPNTVTDDGIKEYTISATRDGGTTWEVIATYTKEPEQTDSIIPLNTMISYNGFKIATTETCGASRNVGFRKVQMYIPAKTTIRELSESVKDVSAYTPLVPLMGTNVEKGFALAQSSTKTNGEAFHAFNQHAITYYIGTIGIVNLESSITNGDGDNSWISCMHSDFSVSYGYLHLIDRGTAGSDPEVVADNGITQYKIYGYRNDDWELISVYNKSASQTDVKIPLDTSEEYYGFKVAATGVIGTTNEIGWRHIQMYVTNRQEIQYVTQVDPEPTVVSSTVHTGLVTYYNRTFIVDTAGQTLYIDNADRLGREISVIPNVATTIVFDDKTGNSQTISLAKDQFSELIWNGTGWILKTYVNFQGTDRNGTAFDYNMNITM